MWLYLLALFVLCFILILKVAIRPRYFYEYPQFMAAVFMAFILPQAYGLVSNRWGGLFLETTLIMSILCLASCWAGYALKPKADILRRITIPINSARLLHGGIAMVTIGFAFNNLVSGVADDNRESTWTGIITIYHFFATLTYPGFAICFYCALRDGSTVGLVGAILGAIIPIQAAVFYGRREPTAMFLMSLALSLYFLRGKVIPRSVAIGAILFAMFGIPATGEYRKLSHENPLTALKEINFVEQFSTYFDEQSGSEIKNATALIAATKISGGYQFGAAYWNSLVYRFIPAQFVGKSLKTSLLIGGEDSTPVRLMENVVGYEAPVGVTNTGVGDAFFQFGYFGCIFFALVGYLFRHLWVAAHDENGILPQVLYIQTLTSAMRSVTHQTVDFLPGFLYMSIFISFIAIYAYEAPQEDEWRAYDDAPNY